MDEKTQALLGPEPIVDPAAQAALERKVEEEDFALRVQMGGRVALVGLGVCMLLAPVLAEIAGSARAWPWMLWTVFNLPLFVLAVLVWRRDRIPVGRGHFLKGLPARRLVLAMLLFSLASFHGLGLPAEVWQWLAEYGW